jgi:hypothetical protein
MRLIDSARNLFHWAMLMTLYSTVFDLQVAQPPPAWRPRNSSL